MRNFDLREYKKGLRHYSKEYRKSLSDEEKIAKDTAIKERLKGLNQYTKAKTILLYVSLPREIDTLEIIKMAFADGKRVAAPRCIDGTRLMDFYYITSISDLEERTFGVLEPKPETCIKVVDFSDSICLVPALIYDTQGYRIGYGAGYYDRFLSKYPGINIGLSYKECVRRKIFHGRYDLPVSILITEKYTSHISRSRKKPSR